jgi:hypothetical protein
MAGVLQFPVLGDHRDVQISLAGFDANLCTYTVQPGDHARVGELALLLTAGQTALNLALPEIGSSFGLSPAACALTLAALKVQPNFSWIPGGALAEAEALSGTLGAILPGSTGGVDRSGIASLVRSYVGFSKGSSQFEEVTQGRNAWSGYSACGDLWNFVLWRMGCRDPSIVNRAEPTAGLTWHVTENLSRPIAGAQKIGAWVPFAPGRVPNVGDLVLIGKYPAEVEHALVHLGVEGGKWVSGDYGQVDDKGLPSSKTVAREQVGNKLGSRTLVGWIDVNKIPTQASANLPSLGSNSLYKFATGVALVAIGAAWLL